MHGKSIISFMLISIGILSLTPIQSREIPRIIKKLNKALGLSPSSEQLFDILPDITKLQTSDATHSAKIATNTAGIAGIQTNVESIQTNADDIKALFDLESMGPGSVWFDAWRTSPFEESSPSFTTITYNDVRESSSYSGALNNGTGMFTAPLAGTYQFIIQVQKAVGVPGWVRILLSGINYATIMSKIYDRDTERGDDSNKATITGTAIITMEAGQKVWAQTGYSLYSDSEKSIHFTGVLIAPK